MIFYENSEDKHTKIKNEKNKKFFTSQTSEVFKMEKNRSFLPHSNMRIKNSHPYKTGNFESQENLKMKKTEVFCISNTGSVQDEKNRSFLPHSNRRIKNSHPYKTGNFESQENLKMKKTGVFCLVKNRKFLR